MPLETATYTFDLVTSNPAHTDGLAQADSHARLIKATIKNTFPNFTAVALQASQAQLDAAVSYTTGLTALGFKVGTAALPGLFPLGNPNTGWWSPATNQLAVSLNGVQTWLMGGTAIVTSLSFTSSLGIAGATVGSVGAFTGGTGQLVPIGATLLWWDDVLPTEGGYAWANGQIIASANTVCPVLLARWGSRFGGNGVTTMGVPDLRDTVPVGKSTMGGIASRALQTLANTVLGTLFGEANHALVAAEHAAHSHVNTLTDPGHLHTYQYTTWGNQAGNAAGYWGLSTNVFNATNNTGSVTTGITITNASQGSGTAHNNVQPSTTANYIIRLA